MKSTKVMTPEAGQNASDPWLVYSSLGALGLLSLVGFFAVFVNIPWEWSMFMDDTIYNSWMPNVTNLWEAIRGEVASYWRIGRFYPVKYVANLLKWKFLPNDPFLFRCFNLSVFLLAASAGVLAAFRGAGLPLRRSVWGLFVFLLGSAILHKPLLEIISLNPLGESWVCLFFSLGAFFLFSEKAFSRYVLARIFFLLVALSKEPTALVFFASALFYFYGAYREPSQRKKLILNGVLDLFLFFSFVFLSFFMMLTLRDAYTKSAYFSSTPWGRYALDFLYKVTRYLIWTSPFAALFLLCWKDLRRLFSLEGVRPLAALIFLLAFGGSYMAFMSTQGIVAYQEVPASIGLFGAFCLLTAYLARNGALERVVRRYGILLVALFAVSYFISVTRWERFVRGIVEPRRAVMNLLATGGEMTLLVPVGEIGAHIGIMIKELNPEARYFYLEGDLQKRSAEFKGRVFLLEFPFYMGRMDGALLESAEKAVDGWAAVTDGKSYRLYRGRRNFP